MNLPNEKLRLRLFVSKIFVIVAVVFVVVAAVVVVTVVIQHHSCKSEFLDEHGGSSK